MIESKNDADRAGDQFIGIRRTELAQERTFLAWWRSALAAFAVSLATGKLIPALSGASSHLPFFLLGIGFALLGLTMAGYGQWRQRVVRQAIAEGRYVEPESWVIALITVCTVALGSALLVILLFF